MRTKNSLKLKTVLSSENMYAGQKIRKVSFKTVFTSKYNIPQRLVDPCSAIEYLSSVQLLLFQRFDGLYKRKE